MRASVLAGSRPVVTHILQCFVLCFLGLLAAPVHDLDVIVEYRSNDWHHIRLDHSCANILRSSDPNIYNALKSQVPFPHIHHVLTPPCFEKAYQPLDAAIDSQDVSYPGRGRCEVCEVIERIDEREGGRAIECSAIIQGSGDADGCLVDIWDTEIDFPHDGVVPQIAVRK